MKGNVQSEKPPNSKLLQYSTAPCQLRPNSNGSFCHISPVVMSVTVPNGPSAASSCCFFCSSSTLSFASVNCCCSAWALSCLRFSRFNLIRATGASLLSGKAARKSSKSSGLSESFSSSQSSSSGRNLLAAELGAGVGVRVATVASSGFSSGGTK